MTLIVVGEIVDDVEKAKKSYLRVRGIDVQLTGSQFLIGLLPTT